MDAWKKLNLLAEAEPSPSVTPGLDPQERPGWLRVWDCPVPIAHLLFIEASGAVTQIWDPNLTFCKSTKPTTHFHSEGELGGGEGI